MLRTLKRYFPSPSLMLVIAFAGGLLFINTQTLAQGNLLVTPMRVVFDGKKGLQELNIANTGKDTARYLVSFIEIRMNEDGTFEKISEPDSGQHFASSFVRFFPRSVVLPPNEAQVVKLQLINTSQLDSGEYRSHIYLRAEPNEKALGEDEPASAKEGEGISVRLTPVFGISIPVIIRYGPKTGAVSLSDLNLVTDGGGTKLQMVFNRSGNTSVYGDITVDHISSRGKTTRVANVRGMAVYTPTRLRHMQVQLDAKPGINYHSGKLVVVYGTTTDDGAMTTLAQAALILK
ncbi:hypothetical protein SAMN04488505_102495 [Chitinophaga rupis]|uniref:Molecular chaperone n=1 Tax=Chitinophaga rupis TaxID=573321 RepID=A0A1H7R1Q2_9BACT|nr:molecular chaperone [Chitinophaga rupis]SEL53845.1 hypothetical protein SAMN04488505_102495 [Chitinophaga rupis]